MPEFVEFPKISRYSRNVVCTEKIDGTNASVYIGTDGEFLTGSRTRWITPDDDNYGFARWAQEYKDELMTLGPGHNFGEWWGSGCQRGYGLTHGERRWSLFNISRWCLYGRTPQPINSNDPRNVKFQTVLPPCVGLVPVLWTGNFEDLNVKSILADLVAHGSYAAPGFMKPEGIVIFHTAANMCFKKTIEKDNERKTQSVTK